MKTLLAEITQKLKSCGCRASKLRQALLELLIEAHQPLSVPELQQYLASKGFAPNKTSLYREIESLLSFAVLEEVSISGVRKVYLPASGHHHHMVCTECKETYCVDDPTLEQALHATERLLAVNDSFLVERHDITFYGRCRSCPHTISNITP